MGKFRTPEIETASRHTMRIVQSDRLADMVKRVYENVPFYKKKLDECGIRPEDIKSVDDLSKLPFTNKTDLRDNYPYGLFALPLGQVTEIHASSGTTGKQTVVGYTENDLKTWGECAARAITAAGGTREDVLHVSYGYGLFTGGLGLHYGGQAMGSTVIPASSGNTARQLTIMQDFGSTILCCTPSYAMYLGESREEAGIPLSAIHLKAGIFGAEPWTEQMRKSIEEKLGIKAYDIYGLSEVMGPGVAFECECQDGLHVNEDFFIPEIIDPETGEVLPDGEYGELVFTCITKEALPLIRYRTRDITCLTHGTCACGRTLVKMGKPRGRSDDMLIIRGVNVFPSQIEEVLLHTKGVTANYQIVVERVNNLDTLEVRVEMAPGMDFDAVRLVEEKEREIKGRLHSVLGLSASVTIVEPKSIERSEGKAKRIIDNRHTYD